MGCTCDLDRAADKNFTTFRSEENGINNKVQDEQEI